MANNNQFVVKHGLLSKDSVFVTGSVIATDGFSGSLFGTSSFALSSSYSDESLSASYSLSSSFSDVSVSSSYSLTASYSLESTSASYALNSDNSVSSSYSLSSSYALTSSYATGLVLQSPSGYIYQLSVTDGGSITTQQIS